MRVVYTHWGFCGESVYQSLCPCGFLVHSNGTSSLPPDHILMEYATTSGMPKVVSGNSITVEPLDHIIF